MANHSKYDENLLPIVANHFKNGWTIQQICTELEIDPKTYAAWREKHAEFNEVCERGLRDRESWWIKKGQENIDNKNFNTALYSIMMQNLNNWNKKTEYSGNLKISHEQMLDELK